LTQGKLLCGFAQLGPTGLGSTCDAILSIDPGASGWPEGRPSNRMDTHGGCPRWGLDDLALALYPYALRDLGLAHHPTPPTDDRATPPQAPVGSLGGGSAAACSQSCPPRRASPCSAAGKGSTRAGQMASPSLTRRRWRRPVAAPDGVCRSCLQVAAPLSVIRLPWWSPASGLCCGFCRATGGSP
jgi:hypothetical protein